MYAEYAEIDPLHKAYITHPSTTVLVPPPPRPLPSPPPVDPLVLCPKGSKKLGRYPSSTLTQNARRGSVVYYSDSSDDDGQISSARFNYEDDSDDSDSDSD